MLEKAIYKSVQHKMIKKAIKSFPLFSACIACSTGSSGEVQLGLGKHFSRGLSQTIHALRVKETQVSVSCA